MSLWPQPAVIENMLSEGCGKAFQNVGETGSMPTLNNFGDSFGNINYEATIVLSVTFSNEAIRGHSVRSQTPSGLLYIANCDMCTLLPVFLKYAVYVIVCFCLKQLFTAVRKATFYRRTSGL